MADDLLGFTLLGWLTWTIIVPQEIRDMRASAARVLALTAWLQCKEPSDD